MKKKVLSCLLCTAMVFSMAACGDNSGTKDSVQDSSVEDSNEPAGGNEAPSEDQTPAEDEAPTEDEAPAEDETPAEAETPAEEETAEVGPASIKVEAESAALTSDGVIVEGDHLGGLNGKAWAKYSVDLKDGNYGQIVIRYGADSEGGTVRLWIGDEDYEEFGTLAGEAEFAGTGAWDNYEEVAIDVPELANQSGTIDVVIECEGPEYLMNPDYFELYKAASASEVTKSFRFFENEFGNGGYRGDEPDYTHIYVTEGSWAGYKINLGEGGCDALELTGDFVGDCSLEVRLDSSEGEVVGEASFAGAADWNDSIIQTNKEIVEVPGLKDKTGIQSIYLVFKSGDYNFAALRFPPMGNEDATKLFAGYQQLTVDIDSVTADFPGFDNEGVTNLFDEDTANKYCVGASDKDAGEPAGVVTVEFALTESAALTGYAFCTANDNAEYPERNPEDWVLYGIDDNGSEVQIDASGRLAIVMDDRNYTYYGRFCNCGTEYTKYKLVITHNGVFQISDFALFGAAK